MTRNTFRINPDTVVTADCAALADKAWITISHHDLTLQPDVTRETASELRRLADEIDQMFRMFGRSAEVDWVNGPFVFRHEPSGELRGEF